MGDINERIIESAMKQIKHYGFRKFTIDDIANDLGISKKTVYKYFASKNEIISTVVDSFLAMAKEKHLEALKVEGGVLEQLDAFVLCPIHDEVPPWLIVELQQFFPEEWKKVNRFKEFNKEQVIKIIDLGIQEKIFRSDIHPALIEMVWEKTTDSIMDFNFIAQHNLTINQALKMLQTIMYHGIINDLNSEVEKI